MSSNKKIILGIDPGFADTGFGIISKDKLGIQFINTGSIQTSKNLDLPERLVIIYKELTKLIKKHKPDIVGIEKLYFSKNVKTALDVGQARGVVILACQEHRVSIVELGPNQVKQAVTGNGMANKRQVGEMVKVIMRLKEVPKPDDAADALAIAIAVSAQVK